MLDDGTILYGEKDDEPSKGQPARPGEEPYVNFMYIDGVKYGDWVEAQNSWCCGEKAGIGTASDGTGLKAWIPYQGNSTEGNSDSAGNIGGIGLQIFPNAGDYHYIDRWNGLILGITVMERDWDRIKETKDNTILDTITNLALTLFTTAQGAFTLDAGKVAAGMKSLAEIAYGKNNQAYGIQENVEKDPDDYMGTEVFQFTRQKAIAQTSKNGVYAFWIQMPTSYYSYCDRAYKVCPPGSPPATMLTRQYFCLVREGTDTYTINEYCSHDKAIEKLLIDPVYNSDIEQAKQKFIETISN